MVVLNRWFFAEYSERIFGEHTKTAFVAGGFNPGGIRESLCFSAAASGLRYESQRHLNPNETLIRVGSKNGGTPAIQGVVGACVTESIGKACGRFLGLTLSRGVEGGDAPNAGRRLTLSGANTYIGATTVAFGILEVSGSSLADGSSLVLDGGTVEVTGGGTETVNTLTVAGNQVLAGTYSSADFVEIASGQIEVLSSPAPVDAYAIWADTNAPTGTPEDDFDGDGVSNALEFVLGGSKDTNDLNKLPTAEATAGDFVFSFVRDQQSATADTIVTIQVTSDLNFPGTSYTVGADTAGSALGVTVVDNTDGTDTVTLSVVRAPDLAKFARLSVVAGAD